MPSNKDRLYVALYARASRPTMPGKEDTYHWALIVGLKIETDGRTSVVEWDKVRSTVMEYCQRKKDQYRFDGQGQFDKDKVPTYDLMERKETIV
ncbi:hypothetical protein ATERTT37_001753 [Aspergillus terreus]